MYNTKMKLRHLRNAETQAYGQKAQLPQRDRATRYVSKFVLGYTRYSNLTGFKQQK